MQARNHENSDEICAQPVRHLDLATPAFYYYRKNPKCYHTVWGKIAFSVAAPARFGLRTRRIASQTSWHELTIGCDLYRLATVLKPATQTENLEVSSRLCRWLNQIARRLARTCEIPARTSRCKMQLKHAGGSPSSLKWCQPSKIAFL